MSQQYNGASPARLAIVSPIAFEDLSDNFDLPDGIQENVNLGLYTEAMREVSQQHGVLFVDVYNPTREWFETSDDYLTIDGSQLTDEGYARFGKLLADEIFGQSESIAEEHRELVHAAVLDKSWMWHNDYKIPNGVHAYGRRFEPFVPTIILPR